MKKHFAAFFPLFICLLQSSIYGQGNKQALAYITLQSGEVITNKADIFEKNCLYFNAGEYNVKIPFSIINSGSFSIDENSDEFPRQANAKIVLSDTSAIEGKISGIIAIENDLGTAQFKLGWEIVKIEFKREGLRRYQEKPIGKKKVTVIKADNSKVYFENAGFVGSIYDKNNNFIKDEYRDYFTFEENGKLYKITWDRIKYFISADKKESKIGTDQYAPLIMVTKEDKKHNGKSSQWIGCSHAIEGIISYNTNYKLLCYVMINHDNIWNSGNIPFVKIEF